jgi:hypothetical protein
LPIKQKTHREAHWASLWLVQLHLPLLYFSWTCRWGI